MGFECISEENEEQVIAFVKEHWFSTEMAVRGKLIDMAQLPGFFLCKSGTIIGLVTYEIDGDECEIMSLDSLKEKQGIGTALVNRVIDTAICNNCKKVKLVTTNDNINAIRFYQTRGFDMVRIYRNAVEAARKLKPSIPLTGDFGIPIKHEIEFEKLLK